MNLKISLNTNQNEGDSKDLVHYSLNPVTTSGKLHTKMIQDIWRNFKQKQNKIKLITTFFIAKKNKFLISVQAYHHICYCQAIKRLKEIYYE